jgi:hypothetical protein
MIIAAALGGIFVATLMLWGWGGAFQRTFGIEAGAWPSTVALGMAVVVFLGGILNLARLAYPWALVGIAAGGLWLALRHGISFKRPPLVVAIPVAIAIVFTIATQLPPGNYNLYDDFQKYFSHPVRMLETGTVFGSPLNALGTQTLGAQAFLDAFVVAFFPIVYINGVDAVFGLFLCMMLAGQFTGGRRELLGMTLVCVLSVPLINPQYVNISALYCGSALIMAIIAISTVESSVPNAAALGLLYAALIAMKPTFAVFEAIHFLAMLVAVRSIGWAIRTGLATAGFLLPWVLLHAPHYLASFGAHLKAPTPVPGEVMKDSLNLFSFAELDYGGFAASYTALVAAMGICALLLLRDKTAGKTIACAASGVATFFVFLYVLGPIHAGYQHALRYFAPILIGLAPAIFGLTAVSARRAWIPLLVAAIPLATFIPSLKTRVQLALTAHSISAFSWLVKEPGYRDYNWRVLYGPEKEIVKTLQGKVPAGEPILAWINAPFYLDYKRNPIIDTEPGGIASPWANIGSARYLIWDYDGYATRSEEEYEFRALDVGAGERRNQELCLDFLHQVEKMVREGEVLYDTGEVKVVRLRK